MEYYIPQKKVFIPQPQRRRRKKAIAIDRSKLTPEELQEMGLVKHVGQHIGRVVNDEKYEALISRVRYMNAHVQKGYKFEGIIPEPKDISYYVDFGG